MPPSTSDSRLQQQYAKYTYPPPTVSGPDPTRNQHLYSSAPSLYYSPHAFQGVANLPVPPPPPLPPGRDSPLPLPASLVPGLGARAQTDVFNTVEGALYFRGNLPGIQPHAGVASTIHGQAVDIQSYSRNHCSTEPALPPKPQAWMNAQESFYPLAVTLPPKLPPKVLASQTEDVRAFRTAESTDSSDEQDDQDLARTLELSLHESGPPNQSEDEILARVLEESLAKASSLCSEGDEAVHVELKEVKESPPSPLQFSVWASTKNTDHVDPQSSRTYNSETIAPVPQEIDLNELERQEQEARRRQLELDEAFARKLVLEEVSKLVLPTSTPSKVPAPSSPQPSNVTLPQLPADDAFLPPPTYENSLSRQQTSLVVSSLSNNSMQPKTNATKITTAPSGASALYPISTLGRSASAQASLNSSASAGKSTRGFMSFPPVPNGGVPPLDYAASVQNTPTSRILDEPGASQLLDSPPPNSADLQEDRDPKESNRAGDDVLSTAPGRGGNGGLLLNSSQPSFVEDELLIGVSLGFNAPSMFSKNEPMQGPIPNIITLPCGKCPPLHIQAQSWKQLLKLLTRLSESRLEPTIEAVAGTKREVRVRTVVQFIKLHHSANDWRTIIYLSIDVPVPADTPNSHRYTNGDVSVLPYSYQSSPLPGLLRAGAYESDVSKCFTVPMTQNNPYPTLPIALPDFAMYLHAILGDSRRAANDAPGGLRRLAKLVDTFYPANNGVSDASGSNMGSERRTVGGFLRRALGRSDRNSQQRGGNSDTYEFISPFRIDEYQ